MSAADARYFELNDDVGLAPTHIIKNGEEVENPAAGTPEPLAKVTLQVGVPTMVDKELVQVAQTVKLDPIPGTRILKIEDPLVASAMSGHPLYHEIDAPSKKTLDTARSTTEDARNAGQEA